MDIEGRPFGHLLGLVTLPVSTDFQPSSTSLEFIVADRMITPVLIGRSGMLALRLRLDSPTHLVTQAPELPSIDSDAQFEINLIGPATIKPRSRAYLHARAPSAAINRRRLVTPRDGLPGFPHLIVPESVVDVDDRGYLHVLVENSDGHKAKLPHGTFLSSLSEDVSTERVVLTTNQHVISFVSAVETLLFKRDLALVATFSPLPAPIPTTRPAANDPLPSTSRANDVSKLDKYTDEQLADLAKVTHLEPAHQLRVVALLREFRDLFLDTPSRTTVASHAIKTTDSSAIFVRDYRRPPHEVQEIAQQIAKLLDKNLVTPSMSPYNAPLLLVKKKNGQQRLVVDYRRLNAVTIRDAFPMPLVDDMLDNLSGSTFFSLLDLESGFHQLPVDPADQHKTAFSGPGGHYEYRRMPFGLTNAPATFQRAMNQVLIDVDAKVARAYIDDILSGSKSVDEGLDKLTTVFTKLRQHDLRLNLDKLKLFQTSVVILGWLVSRDGIRPDPDKISAVHELAEPTNVVHVQHFMGIINFYGRLISHLSDIASPLYRLTRKGVSFEWGEEQRAAFNSLKAALCSSPVVRLPDFSRSFIVASDASDLAAGAVLSQQFDDGEHAVAYYSFTFNSAEQRYSATERECLALIRSIEHWRVYLLGKRFTAFTDHASLQWLLAVSDPNGRLVRWRLRLSAYDCDVIHRPGKDNIVPDALSRLPRVAIRPDDNATAIAAFFAAIPTGTSSFTAGYMQEAPTFVACLNTPDGHPAAILLTDRPAVLKPAAPVDSAQANPSLAQAAADSLLGPELGKEFDLPRLQRDDHQLKHYLTYMETRRLPRQRGLRFKVQKASTSLMLDNGVLFFADDSVVDGSNVPYRRLAVPASLRRLVFEALHTNGGHPGFRRLYTTIRTKFWWPSLYADTVHFLNDCPICPRYRFKNGPGYKSLHPLETSRPLEVVAIDLVGPFKAATDSGCTHILTLVDHFTRFAAAWPTAYTDGQSIARILWDNFFSLVGPPLKLLTDNGSNLTASPLTSLCNRLHIHRLYITPYHHSANGVVEKFNGTIVQMLAPTINGDIGRWDEDVPAMVFAYNCAVNSATGHTPYEAFFGRQPVLPIENMLLPFVPNDIDVDTYGDVVREHAQRVHSRILQATQESRAMRSAQAANTPAHSYEVHDRVYILRRRKPDYTPAKLIARWVGPFQVTRMLNPVTAKLRGRNGELPRAFHASRLKPCYDMNSPLAATPSEAELFDELGPDTDFEGNTATANPTWDAQDAEYLPAAEDNSSSSSLGPSEPPAMTRLSSATSSQSHLGSSPIVSFKRLLTDARALFNSASDAQLSAYKRTVSDMLSPGLGFHDNKRISSFRRMCKTLKTVADLHNLVDGWISNFDVVFDAEVRRSASSASTSSRRDNR